MDFGSQDLSKYSFVSCKYGSEGAVLNPFRVKCGYLERICADSLNQKEKL